MAGVLGGLLSKFASVVYHEDRDHAIVIEEELAMFYRSLDVLASHLRYILGVGRGTCSCSVVGLFEVRLMQGDSPVNQVFYHRIIGSPGIVPKGGGVVRGWYYCCIARVKV